jgi:hypothetical protein
MGYSCLGAQLGACAWVDGNCVRAFAVCAKCGPFDKSLARDSVNPGEMLDWGWGSRGEDYSRPWWWLPLS